MLDSGNLFSACSQSRPQEDTIDDSEGPTAINQALDQLLLGVDSALFLATVYTNATRSHPHDLAGYIGTVLQPFTVLDQ